MMEAVGSRLFKTRGFGERGRENIVVKIYLYAMLFV
jgi:hypothetical protein